MSAQLRTTTTIQLTGQVTVQELRTILEEVPGNGTVGFRHFDGTQREPAYTTLTITHDTVRTGR